MHREGIGNNDRLRVPGNLLSAYQNDTGDFAAEMEIGMGDLDAVTAGIYLSNSEIALISSVLSNKYVFDLESENELGDDTTLEERLIGLLNTKDDEELKDIETRLFTPARIVRKSPLQRE